MEERLRYIFDLVNDWLKFADAKNGALFVAASGLAIATAKLGPRLQAHTWPLWIGSAGFVFLVLAALICLFSFLPHLRFLWLLPRAGTSKDDNLFFYGHIANYAPGDYLRALRKAAGEVGVAPDVERHLSGQIVINSRIALQKFRLARAAAYLLFAGAVIVIAIGCIHLFTNAPANS